MPNPVVVPTPQSLAQLVGHEVAVTDWLPGRHECIQQFADATDTASGSTQILSGRDGESPYATTVAHGFLTLSLLSSC
jgi:hypothetical protein